MRKIFNNNMKTTNTLSLHFIVIELSKINS